MDNNKKELQTFDEWFYSLSTEETADYVESLEADYWVDYYKSFPNE